MNSKRTEVFLNIAIVLLFTKLVSSEVLVLEDGMIEGVVLQSRLGTNFYAFRGIPFAEPPIGDLRFKAPVPKTPWTGIHDCKQYGSMCMQPIRSAVSEDCLFLNVFSKNISPSTSVPLKPVIVFLFGGGFELGAGDEYGPEYLMDRDVVLVTINYRLGPFGFLALDTSDIPGNAAMKDQVLALKWVQKNIEIFGGDPNKVTLAGLSAGAHSATGHMLSSLSDGLFHNVIAVSGGLAWQKTLRKENIASAKILAERVSCATNNTESMVQCLRQKPAPEIAANMIISFFECPIMTWQPVVERDFEQERFLVDQPNNLLKAGLFAKVNVMIGITADEFISPIAVILRNETLTTTLDEKFDEIAPNCFMFEGNDYKSSSEVSQILRKSYLPFDSIDIRSFSGLSNFIGDGIIGYGVHRFVHYISNFTDVYYYKFSYAGRNSRFYYPRNHPYGVHHVDDIQYIFKSLFIGPEIQESDPENFVVERMTRIWEQFASTGNPNNATDEYLSEMVWPKHDSISEYYLDIGNHLVEKNGLFLERYTVWDNLESSSFMLEANIVILITLLKLLI